MRKLFWIVLVAAAAGLPAVTRAQGFAANYELTRPVAEAAFPPGPEAVRFGRESGLGGAGLALQLGPNWFAGAGLGGGMDGQRLALGGGYRWDAGQSLSLQVLRPNGQAGTGLAVRYDWADYYLRLSYDRRWGADANTDRFRFSAGMRF